MTETEWTALTITLTVMLWVIAIAAWLPPMTPTKITAFFEQVFASITEVVTWVLRKLRIPG